MIIKEDLGIYTDIYDTGKKVPGRKCNLYHAKCKICGKEVEKSLYEIRKSKQCCHLPPKNKYALNGYVDLYLPNHHLARSSGLVYEHLIVAEKKLGRELKDGEVVHHINRKRNDNREENLMIFISNSDHCRFHQTGVAIQNEDGTYYSPAYNNLCIDCGEPISKDAKRCLECNKKFQASNIPEKETLEKLLQNNSLCAIGRMYGVSGNAVKKWKIKYCLL